MSNIGEVSKMVNPKYCSQFEVLKHGSKYEQKKMENELGIEDGVVRHKPKVDLFGCKESIKYLSQFLTTSEIAIRYQTSYYNIAKILAS